MQTTSAKPTIHPTLVPGDEILDRIAPLADQPGPPPGQNPLLIRLAVDPETGDPLIQTLSGGPFVGLTEAVLGENLFLLSNRETLQEALNQGWIRRSKARFHEFWRGHIGARVEHGLVANDSFSHEWYTQQTQKEDIRTGDYVYQAVDDLIPKKSRILEIGSGVGRNLNFLAERNFRNLTGIEINRRAVEIMPTIYPLMNTIGATLIIGPAEEGTATLADDSYDLVLATSTLAHIHPKGESLFRRMVRLSRNLILVFENEASDDVLRFPRNYDRIFTDLGCREILNQPHRGGYTLRLFEV